MINKRLFSFLLVLMLSVCTGCGERGSSSEISGEQPAQQEPIGTEQADTTRDDRAENVVVPSGDVSYTLKLVDQKGRPVQGVVVKVCNVDSCVMAVSDESGLCELTLPAYPYEVNILKLPDGYEPGKNVVYTAPENGGELVITLIRNH